MTKKCAVSGKKPMSGNNVSHSNRHTRRVFNPNLQTVALYSEVLAMPISVRVSSTGLRTVEKNGGLDLYVLNTSVSKLSPECKKLRDRIIRAKAKKEK